MSEEGSSISTDKLCLARRPVRSFMDNPNITWRFGSKPDYTKADEFWLKTKQGQHAADSLETLVEDLVKTWEMESSHKPLAQDWGSIDRAVYRISANKNPPVNIEENILVGNYNVLLLDQTPAYDARKISRDESHDFFTGAFGGLFPWEVIKVYTGPPRVAFDWRHWAVVTKEYSNSRGEKVPASNKTVELFGHCVATVNEELKIQAIEVHYDPKSFMEALEHGTGTNYSEKELKQFSFNSKRCPFSDFCNK